jgi:hypothetical protein
VLELALAVLVVLTRSTPTHRVRLVGAGLAERSRPSSPTYAISGLLTDPQSPPGGV